MKTLSGHKTVMTIFTMCMTFIFYSSFASILDWQHSIAPYYVELADAMLEGKLHLDNPPNNGFDLIDYHGYWYVAQPPLPAVLMLPLAFIRGAKHISDVIFTSILGAISVGLASVAMRQYLTDLSKIRHVMLVLFFAFGSVQLFLSVVAGVWYTAQVTACLFTWLFLVAWDKHWYFLTGFAAGCVLHSRPSIVPALVFIIILTVIFDVARATQLSGKQIRALFVLMIGFLPGLIFWGAYNMARFGTPSNIGYDYLLDAEIPRMKRLEHGLFNMHFLPENLYVASVRPLKIRPDCILRPDCGVIETDQGGAGLLWTSPLLLLVILVRPANEREKQHLYALSGAAILAMIPALLYHNTGASHFGYRFLLDGLPFIMLLVGFGSRRVPVIILTLMTMWSVALHLWGTIWFIRLYQG